jgi:hypothetical protein
VGLLPSRRQGDRGGRVVSAKRSFPFASDDDLLQTLPISKRLRLHELDSTSKKMLLAMLRIEHERGAPTTFITDDGRGYKIVRSDARAAQ